MVSKEDIKQALPYGGQQRIAKKAGVGHVAVSEFFRGKNNSERIYQAALEVYVEVQALQTETRAKLAAALGLSAAQ